MLVARKIIPDPEYWQVHCEGEKVAELLVKMAAAFSPVSNLAEPCRCCSRDYWVERAAPDRKCSGEYVGRVIEKFVTAVNAQPHAR
ncbi:MAG: hypothetical protein M3463_01890 [Verrucomicrobiota bacterium]|nr:hypothetical protein [Verrucomicrobiota bacterium]